MLDKLHMKKKNLSQKTTFTAYTEKNTQQHNNPVASTFTTNQSSSQWGVPIHHLTEKG